MFDWAINLYSVLAENVFPWYHFAKDLYVEWWLTPWVLVPVTLLAFVFLFAFEFRINGGNIPIWRGILEEARFFLPGGTNARINFLKTHVFCDWQDCLRGKDPIVHVNEWSSMDFACAFTKNDRKTLKKMIKVLGSGWNFWVILPVLSLGMAAIFPMVLTASVVILAIMLAILTLLNQLRKIFRKKLTVTS